MKEWISFMNSSTTNIKETLSSPNKFINLGWKKLSKLPAGKKLFAALIGRYIPYTGSIKPFVQSIKKGHVKISMKDRHAVRNHLNSIHALALANLGEFTTGLCLFSQLADGQKAILTHIEVEYLKKARGDLLSEAKHQLPKTFESDTDFPISAEIKNKNNEIVSKVHATWRVRL